MKKYLVIKVYDIMHPAVQTSFDSLEDAKTFASLCKKMDDGKYDYVVAQLL